MLTVSPGVECQDAAVGVAECGDLLCQEGEASGGRACAVVADHDGAICGLWGGVVDTTVEVGHFDLDGLLKVGGCGEWRKVGDGSARASLGDCALVFVQWGELGDACVES